MSAPVDRPRVESVRRQAPLGPILIVVSLVVLGLLTWVLIRSKGPEVTPEATANARTGSARDSAGLGFGAGAETVRPASSSGATVVSFAPSPSFARLDIHKVPLGTILDYAAEVVEYDDSRARSFDLPPSASGQRPYVTVTPAEGAWAMTPTTLGEGHIVARIQSVGAHDDLGVASGMNFLWTGNDPEGRLQWVLIPATAFAPIRDLNAAEARTLVKLEGETQ